MALTADADLSIAGGQYRRLPSEISANPYAGSLLSYAADGYAHELVAGELFAGVCVEPIATAVAATADGTRNIGAICGEFAATIPVSVTTADIGRRVYATDDGTFSLTQAGAATLIGRVIGVESSSKAIVQCRTQGLDGIMTYSLAAAGTALTNSTTRTALASWTIKAGTLKVGSRIRARGQAIATATNSTDTLTLDIGGAVGGSPAAIVASTATDVANNNIGTIDMDIVIRTVGSSGTYAGFAKVSTLAASGTSASTEVVIASATINTDADLVLGLYGTWSVANAGNSCRADTFNVDLVR